MLTFHAGDRGPGTVSQLEPGLCFGTGLRAVSSRPPVADFGVPAARQRRHQCGSEGAVELPDDFPDTQASRAAVSSTNINRNTHDLASLLELLHYQKSTRNPRPRSS